MPLNILPSIEFGSRVIVFKVVVYTNPPILRFKIDGKLFFEAMTGWVKLFEGVDRGSYPHVQGTVAQQSSKCCKLHGPVSIKRRPRTWTADFGSGLRTGYKTRTEGCGPKCGLVIKRELQIWFETKYNKMIFLTVVACEIGRNSCFAGTDQRTGSGVWWELWVICCTNSDPLEI